MPRPDLHLLAEERSLAYHRAVADRLRRDPTSVARALARAEAWCTEGGHASHYAAEWRDKLRGPLNELLALLVDPSEHARALRQATPFAGFLDPRERWRIWREVRERFESAQT